VRMVSISSLIDSANSLVSLVLFLLRILNDVSLGTIVMFYVLFDLMNLLAMS